MMTSLEMQADAPRGKDYTGDALPEDRYLSPVLADFDGLPPILGQVGSTEILLDDTVRAGELDELPFRYGRSKARQ